MRYLARLPVLLALCLLPLPALANIYEDAQRAYNALKVSFDALPEGQCLDYTAPPVRPYREALERLLEFEQIAAEIPNRPNLTEHRIYLTDIVDYGRSPCFDKMAGISFYCNGPCPERTYDYVPSPDLGNFQFVAAPTTPSRVNGFSVVRADFDTGGYIRMHENGYWYEYNPAGKRIFRFEELGRDRWTVHLNDRSRNLQLLIDLRRKLIMVGGNFGSKRTLYRIVGASTE